jgi:hypothetical protein
MNIPITLITYSLTHKVVNQLRLYLYLKSVCSGHFKLREGNVTEACEFLDLKSEKTFHKNLQWLIYYKWVAYNSKTMRIRVISFSRIYHKLEISNKSGVIFEKEDFQSFRPFLYAAVYAWSIRHKNWLERQPVRKEGRARKSMSKPTPDFYRGQMPNRYLAKILQLDHSTISRYKKAVSTAGYIITKHGYEDLQLQLKFIDPLKKSIPEEAHLFVAYNNSIHRQLPDEITSTIHLKRRNLRPP